MVHLNNEEHNMDNRTVTFHFIFLNFGFIHQCPWLCARNLSTSIGLRRINLSTSIGLRRISDRLPEFSASSNWFWRSSCLGRAWWRSQLNLYPSYIYFKPTSVCIPHSRSFKIFWFLWKMIDMWCKFENVPFLKNIQRKC